MKFNEIIALMKLDSATESHAAYRRLVNAVDALSEVYDENKYADGKPDEEENMASVSAYRKKLGAVMDAAEIYLNHFNDDPNGKTYVNRKNIATALRRELNDKYMNAVKAEEVRASEYRQKASSATMIASGSRVNSLAKYGELQKISDLHKNIGGTGLKVKENTFKPDDYSGKGKWATFKHGFKWLFSGASVINFTLWIGAKIATRSEIRENKARIMGSTFDESKVPGSKNEHFESIEDTRKRVNSLADDQPVLNEKKRPPIVYERKVPGDVNAKPTITLKISEGIEGKNIGYDPKLGSGHGYITLNYTKVNPLSGQPERYELTMGFFPKGGFNATSITVAQTRAGLRTPGQLRCDENNVYSVAKTFEIDNKRINQVILAAQEYEKEGYNSIDRNCSTFVHDMAEIARVNDDKLIRESELVKRFSFKESLLHFGSGLMVRKGVNEMLKKAGRTDYSYQRYGQKMITENEVQKLKLLEHHKRMIGYLPSHIGESIRNSKGYTLNARTEMVLKARSYETGYKVTVGEARGYLNAFDEALERYVRKHENVPGVKEVSDQLISYIDTKISEMKHLGSAIYSKSEPSDDSGNIVPQTVESAKKKMVMGIENIDETVEKINEVFKDAFKSDPDLNVEFSSMVGALNAVKGVLERDFTRIEVKLRVVDPKEMRSEPYKSDYDAFVDPNRDDADAVRRMNFQLHTLETNVIAVTPIQMAAAIKAYGSIKDLVRYYEMDVQTEEEKENWEDADKQFYKTMKLKSTQFDHFVAAEKSVFTNEKPYKSDYKMAFIDMPQTEKEFLSNDFSGDRPSDVYKVEMLDHVFGKRHGSVSIKESLSQINEKEPKEFETAFKKALSDALMKNLQGNNEFDKLHEIIMNDLVEKLPKDELAKNNPLAIQANVKEKASDIILDSLKQQYVKSILADLKDKGTPVIDLEKIDFKVDPEFASFREAYNQKAGVQIDLQDKRSDCYIEIRERLSAAKEKSAELTEKHGAKKLSAYTEEFWNDLKPLVAKAIVYSMISATGVTKPLSEENLNAEIAKVMKKPGFDDLMNRNALRELRKSYEDTKDAISPLEAQIIDQIVKNKEINIPGSIKPRKKIEKTVEKKPAAVGGKQVK